MRFSPLVCALLLVFSAQAEEVPVVRFQVNDFAIQGENPISEGETHALLNNYLGAHEGLDGLLDAATALEGRLREDGFTFHRVILPPQTMENGIIMLRVVRFSVGQISVSGNSHFSEANIRRSLPALQQGVTPNTRELARSLKVSNQHPARKTLINIKESQQEDAVDVELKVTDSKPWMVFAGLNNIGTDQSGRLRASFGGQHSNLFGRDHVGTVSYTTAPQHPQDVKQYGLSYQIPIYQQSGRLNFFYSRSDVDTGTVQQVFDVTGAGTFFGVNYEQALLRMGSFTHSLNLGVQDKSFENDVLLTGTALNFGGDVRSRPLSLTYSGQYTQQKSISGFSLSYVRNIGGGSNNSDTAYAAARSGADQDWDALRFYGHMNYFLPRNWLLRAEMEGQLANEPLIAGEQFGLGGSASVRGFEERALAADSGLRTSLEIWLPPAKYLNNLRLLGFVDAAYKDLENAQPGEIHADSIISTGLGLRYQHKDYISMQFDYGYVINEAAQLANSNADSGAAKIHFNLFVRY